MQKKRELQHVLPRGARLGTIAGVLAFAWGAVGGCATSTVPEDEEGTPSSSATSSEGGGGAGGAGGGDGGGPRVCDPGITQPCYAGPEPTKGVGACVGGTQTCADDGSGFGPCEGQVTPVEETCENPADEDCDGMANESGNGCICTPGLAEGCYSGPDGTQGVGACKEGMRTCSEQGSSWGVCEGEMIPAAEDCSNTLDDDCDGAACAGPVWNLIFGGAQGDLAGSVAVDSAGSVFVAGVFSGSMVVGADTLVSAGGADIFLVKLDAQGNYIWSQNLGDAADQGATSVAVDSSGNVIVAGSFSGTIKVGMTTLTASGKDAFVAKFGSTGAPLWGKKLGAQGNQAATAVAVDASGNVFVTGAFDGTLFCPFGCITSKGGQDIFLFKFDAQGVQQWLKTAGDVGDQIPNALVVDAAGNVFLAGQIQGSSVDFGGGAPLGSAGGFDAFAVKLDASGAHVWSKRFGDPFDQQVYSLAVGPAGEVVLAGSFAGSINFGALDVQSAGLSDAFVVKLDADGIYQWEKRFGDAAEQAVYGAVIDAAGDILAIGGFQGMVDFGGGPLSSAVSNDVFILKMSGGGGHLWSRSFGNIASQIGTDLVLDPTSGHLIATVSAAGTIDFGLGALTSAGAEDVVLVNLTP